MKLTKDTVKLIILAKKYKVDIFLLLLLFKKYGDDVFLFFYLFQNKTVKFQNDLEANLVERESLSIMDSLKNKKKYDGISHIVYEYIVGNLNDKLELDIKESDIFKERK